MGRQNVPRKMFHVKHPSLSAASAPLRSARLVGIRPCRVRPIALRSLGRRPPHVLRLAARSRRSCRRRRPIVSCSAALLPPHASSHRARLVPHAVSSPKLAKKHGLTTREALVRAAAQLVLRKPQVTFGRLCERAPLGPAACRQTVLFGQFAAEFCTHVPRTLPARPMRPRSAPLRASALACPPCVKK